MNIGHHMRPGQHNKRSRGRNNNRRHGGGGGGGGGGGNPLSRVYESNGPDVKVRGTAQTVADKYLQLGRDAHSAGDTVTAESYYQHAEHYLRLLAAAQAYNQQMNPQAFRQSGQDEFEEGEGDEGGEETGEGQPQPQPQGERPPLSPDQQEMVASFEAEQRPPRENYREREFRPRQEGQNRDRFRPRWQDRQPQRDGGGGEPRQSRPPQQQQEESQSDERPQRQSRPPQDHSPSDERPQRQPEAAEAAQWGEGEQPSFLRRSANGQPQRAPRGRPRREAAPEAEPAEASPQPEVPPVE
jgi:hypothetical protein